MKISACVITKNEEKNLPTCLNSIKTIVSEIIVVDTGSTDRTIEIANSYGAKVYHFDWVNDFAKARNYAISKAKSDWIIFLDADESFADECVKYIAGAIKEADSKKMDMIICMMSNVEKSTGKIVSSNAHIRIFKNHPQIRYVGAIHERIVRLDRPGQALDVQQDITIIHTGYSKEELTRKSKGKRNLEILFQELEKKPESCDLLFYISESYLVDKEFQKALDYAIRADKIRNSELKGIYQKNYVNMFQCMIHLSMPKETLHSTILKAIEEFPEYPDFHMYLGDHYTRTSQYRDAILSFEKGLTFLNQAGYGQSSAIATAVKVLETVANLYEETKQWQKCVQYYVQVLQIDKYMYSSLLNVMRVLGKFDKPENIIGFLTKIYDKNRSKDCLYLLQAALATNQPEIASQFINSLPAEILSAHEYEAVYLFITGRYESACARFKELFLQSQNDEYAYGAIAAAWMSGDSRLSQEILTMARNLPQIHMLASNMLEKSFSVSIDKKLAFSFCTYLISSLHVHTYRSLVGVVKNADLLIEVADLLYHKGLYEDAYLFYNEYLENIQQIPKDALGDLTYKVGDCLLQTGQTVHALLFLEKAQSLSPKDYRIIESYIQIASQNIHPNDMRKALETAITYFPDSISLRTCYQESKSI